MKTAVFSSHKFEKDYLITSNNAQHDLKLIEDHLTEGNVNLAKGCEAACIFVNDEASASVLEKLKKLGIKYIALRSTGYNHVDLEKAKELNLKIANVPDYSPYAIAEHTVAMMLTLNRKLIKAHNRIVEQNFSLDGLVGFNMNEKTVGIIGTGKTGSVVAKILHGFGCKLLAFDLVHNESLKNQFEITYTDCETLCRESDIITLHTPLTNDTKYIIDHKYISIMKPKVMIINTGRGGLINTKEIIEALKAEKIGYFGMDVYENEKGLFFEDHSEGILQDDTFARLMTLNNVMITSHQAFLTDTALKDIAKTTIHNLDCFEKGIHSENEII